MYHFPSFPPRKIFFVIHFLSESLLFLSQYFEGCFRGDIVNLLQPDIWRSLIWYERSAFHRKYSGLKTCQKNEITGWSCCGFFISASYQSFCFCNEKPKAYLYPKSKIKRTFQNRRKEGKLKRKLRSRYES